MPEVIDVEPSSRVGVDVHEHFHLAAGGLKLVLQVPYLRGEIIEEDQQITAMERPDAGWR